MEQQNNFLEVEQNSSDSVQPIVSSNKSFIEANTVEGSLEELRHHHIIPVFVKDNEPLISQADFIETVYEAAVTIFSGEQVLQPAIRLSHPIKGRIPEAKDKPASQLLDSERTLYFERMGFALEISSISDTIDGNPLSLTIGGVKSYNQDNLYTKKGAEEHFKVFIGFQNTVCTNLCVWTDGVMGDLRVKNIGQLKAAIYTLLNSYNQGQHLYHLKKLQEYSLSEKEFALLIGRCRMYSFLPNTLKKEIPALQFGDSQLAAIVKDYYRDNSFCRDAQGNINLWKLYNLFTGANKSTYIDQFLERSMHAYEFIEQLRWGFEGRAECWYLK